MPDATKTITISKEEYDELKDELLFLECLRNGGVDNWDWYGEALSEYQRQKENKNDPTQ